MIRKTVKKLPESEETFLQVCSNYDISNAFL